MRVLRISRALLLAIAGDGEAEFVIGDLDEEFAVIAEERGQREAGRWYLRQVVRSTIPLIVLRARSGELMEALLAGLLAALPLWLCDRLWCFIYSQIPLKDGLGRAPGMLACNLAVLAIGALLAGAAARSRARAISVALASLLTTAVAVAASASAAPPLYIALAMTVAPAGGLLSFSWRRSR
jgi:hypothetical protein